MKKWEIWVEGYRTTCVSACAKKLCEIESDTFREACDEACNKDQHYNSTKLTLWGCRLFDNEVDARKSFG